MAISSIVLAELLRGVEKSSDPPRNLAIIADFCSRLTVLAHGEKAARHYGSIRAALEKLGTLRLSGMLANGAGLQRLLD